MPELSERLKYIRKIKNLSQIDLARIAGTTQQAIQQAESGKAQSPRYLHKISLDLNVPYEWLTMNIIPKNKADTKTSGGFSERDKEVLDSYFAMPRKDQEILLELMKSRHAKEK